MVELNYIFIVVAALIVQPLGALWYSPFMFGTQWMKEVKFTKKDIEKAKKKGMAKSMAFSFIAALVMSSVLAYLYALLEITTLVDHLCLAAMLWFGIIATSFLNGVLWEGKSLALYFIYTGHLLVQILVIALVLSF